MARITCFLLDGGTTEAGTINSDWFDQAFAVKLTAISSERTALQRELARAAINGDADCILCIGGTANCANHEAVAVVEGLADRMLPGFGELLRHLIFQAAGPSAMFAHVGAALVGDCPVYVLPADDAIIRLAWNELIKPNLSAGSRGAAQALSQPVSEPGPLVNEPTGWVEVDSIPSVGTPFPAVAPAPSGAGWKAALAKLGGELDYSWPAIPDSLARIAPARNVLETAGERGLARFSEGPSAVLCGFPDLRRPSSKVLMIREGSPWPEVIALHRFPRRIGTVTSGGADYFGEGLDADELVVEQVGRLSPGRGRLFAVDGRAVFLVDGERVSRWDGRRETDEGSVNQCIASLLLAWTSR